MTPVRLAAVRVLLTVERGRTTLDAAIDRARRNVDDDRDRSLLVELTAGVLRWRAELDALLDQCSGRPSAELDPGVRAILRVGAYQLRHLDRIPAHAAVHESVELTRAIGQPQAAGFVNGVLRTLHRRRLTLRLPPRPGDAAAGPAWRAYLATTLSHPEWLVERWTTRHGAEATEAWCRFNNASPEITARPSAGVSLADVLRALGESGVAAAAAPFVRDAIRLAPGSLGHVPADIRRQLIVQDEASQIVAHVVAAQPGGRALDLCAAPGGKTAILATAIGAPGLLVAADRRPARVRLLAATLRTTAAGARVVALDATRTLPFGAVFDRVLLDAPCSGLGTLRRDPDLKWSRTPADLERFARTQRAMLRRAADAVRPGGALTYATCSSEPEENEAVVEEFLREDSRFALARARPGPAVAHAEDLVDAGGFLRTLPFAHGLDAFFAAVLVRRRSA